MFKLVLSFSVLLALAAAHHSDPHGCKLDAAPGTVITTTITHTTTVGTIGNDGVIGVSPKDLAIIRSTWESAKKDGDVAPQILFRFLQAHPELQKKFSKFADVPQSQLLKNGRFLAQAYTIMAGLNVVIESSGSSDMTAMEVNNLGAAHFERGVTIAQFEQLGSVIVDVLQDELNLDADAVNAWQNGLAALIQGVSKSLKRREDVAHPLTKLTPHQIADVRRTWQSIRNDRYSIVSQLFMKLFKEKPGAQQKFSTFGQVPLNDLPTNTAFNAQVRVVGDRLDEQIEAMDKTLQWLGQMRYMAFSHKPRAVYRQEFMDFGRLLMDLIRSKGVSDDDLDSWKGVLNVWVNSVSKVQGL